MACDVNQLLEDGKCLVCLTSKEQQAIITQLLCEIANGGGGETFNLLDENNNPLIDENANNLVYQ